MALTNAEKQARWKERKSMLGMQRIELWLRPEELDELRVCLEERSVQLTGSDEYTKGRKARIQSVLDNLPETKKG